MNEKVTKPVGQTSLEELLAAQLSVRERPDEKLAELARGPDRDLLAIVFAQPSFRGQLERTLAALGEDAQDFKQLVDVAATGDLHTAAAERLLQNTVAATNRGARH